MKRSVILCILAAALLLNGCSSRSAAAAVTPEADNSASGSQEFGQALLTPLSSAIDSVRSEGTTQQPAGIGAPDGAAVPKASPEAGSEWMLMLVNADHPIGGDYEPELEDVQNGYRMDARVAPVMRRMISDAAAQGVQLLVCSAYRPYASQERNFNAKVTEYQAMGYGLEDARAATLRLIAAPGASEHHTGLAADIVTPAYQGLDDGYAETAAAKWLLANAADYGFILRYPREKQQITGIDFEPWHYRYVGEKAAKEIMDAGICLEEYV